MDATLITVLSNLGTGGIVVILVCLGYLIPKPAYVEVVRESARKDQVIARKDEVIALERQRSNDVTQAGAVTNQLIAAVYSLAAEHHTEPGPAPADTGHLPSGPDPAGKDIRLCGGIT